MAIVRDVHRSIDAMQVQVLQDGADGQATEPSGKPIYALGQFQWGAFRDVEERIDKYWMWAGLRAYAAYYFGSFKDLTWDCSCQLRYTVPCDGCNKCQSSVQVVNNVAAASNRRWWHAFLPRTSPAGN